MAALVAGCARPPAPPGPARLVLEPASFDALPGWNGDDVAATIPALLQSCARRQTLTPTATVGPAGIGGTVADWRSPCAAAAALPAGDDQAARHYFEVWFQPWLATDNGVPDGVFTGYYEPLLEGARERGGVNQTPLLRRPPDLVTVQLGLFRPEWHGERTAGRVVGGALVPYPSRAEIERGALDNSRLALFWVADPVDAFFLQVQGSGKVRLPDGTVVGVGYDGQNGRPYVSIGKLLIERGELTREQVSLDAIRAWIRAHGQEGRALLDANPSYVFFRAIAGPTPVGAEGVVLTAGRSLAVDPAFLPLGVPLWLDVVNDDVPLRRLVIAQDTGGAVRGPVRGDLYWGSGREAEHAAGSMKAHGRYFLLLPRKGAAILPTF